jgi:long-chain acyl-CoA synthetase
VVTKDPALSADVVIEHCRKSLTKYKIPKKVVFVDDVPVTLSGKVLRRQLRDKYLA